MRRWLAHVFLAALCASPPAFSVWALPPSLLERKKGQPPQRMEVPVADASQPEDPVELQAMLAINDSVVLEGQDVPLKLELRNVSNAPLSVCRGVSSIIYSPCYVVFRATRPDGSPVEILQAEDDHDLPLPESYVRLEPGAAHHVTVMMDPVHGEATRFIPLEPGRYVVSLEVVLLDDGRRIGVADAWVGSLLTNAVTIEIVKAKDE